MWLPAVLSAIRSPDELTQGPKKPRLAGINGVPRAIAPHRCMLCPVAEVPRRGRFRGRRGPDLRRVHQRHASFCRWPPTPAAAPSAPGSSCGPGAWCQPADSAGLQELAASATPSSTLSRCRRYAKGAADLAWLHGCASAHACQSQKAFDYLPDATLLLPTFDGLSLVVSLLPPRHSHLDLAPPAGMGQGGASPSPFPRPACVPWQDTHQRCGRLATSSFLTPVLLEVHAQWHERQPLPVLPI